MDLHVIFPQMAFNDNFLKSFITCYTTRYKHVSWFPYIHIQLR